MKTNLLKQEGKYIQLSTFFILSKINVTNKILSSIIANTLNPV